MFERDAFDDARDRARDLQHERNFYSSKLDDAKTEIEALQRQLADCRADTERLEENNATLRAENERLRDGIEKIAGSLDHAGRILHNKYLRDMAERLRDAARQEEG